MVYLFAMKNTQNSHNVLVVFSLVDKACRDHFAGVLDAMSDKSDWHLYSLQPGKNFTAKDVLGLNGQKYDGFIISMPGTNSAMRELARTKLPIVLVNITDKSLSAKTDSISMVWLDNADIGQSGAKHLLSRGAYKSAGFIHETHPEFYSYEREVAFRQTMKRAGYDSTSFPENGCYEDFQSRLRTWLRNLPKPAAIMAVSDMRAADVINACKAECIPIPEQVAVVGVDNDLAQHAKCEMPISSVLPDSRRMGQLAVKELEFLFKHPRRTDRPHEVLVPVKEVVMRESTARSLPAAKLVHHALEFISANHLRRISCTDVISHLGCSRQLAELRFRQTTGKTIRTTIETMRLDEAHRLLHSRNLTVRQVAKDLEFKSANQLSRIYKRHFGKTIAEARKDLK